MMIEVQIVILALLLGISLMDTLHDMHSNATI